MGAVIVPYQLERTLPNFVALLLLAPLLNPLLFCVFSVENPLKTFARFTVTNFHSALRKTREKISLKL